MKVLFVYGLTNFSTNPVVEVQGESLKRNGIQVEYFANRRKALKGYLRFYIDLRGHLQRNRYDIVHAHFSFSGIVAALANRGGVTVTSLLGSDVNAGWHFKMLSKLFARFIWSATVVKSQRMWDHLALARAEIMPNGVNRDHFFEMDQQMAKNRVGFTGRNIIFVCVNAEAPVKNYALAKTTVQLLGDDSVKLQVISKATRDELPFYFNAADALLLTSWSEGSPNVVKEAMACNCPVVATDVGDVAEVIGLTEGCYVTNFTPADVAEKLRLALSLNKRTNGRDNITHLDINVIAQRLIRLYHDLLAIPQVTRIMPVQETHAEPVSH